MYSFTGNLDGAQPKAALVQGVDGNFYGTTSFGGLLPGGAGAGTVFNITPQGTLTALYTDSAAGLTGAHSRAARWFKGRTPIFMGQPLPVARTVRELYLG